jgi:ABC-type sugar transport system ATPase subunit
VGVGEASSTLLKVQDVSVTFQGSHGKMLHVLSGLTFSLHGGKLAVVLGDSGSGKTTLLNVIAGFLRPSDGIIRGYLPQTTKIKGNVFIEGDIVTSWEPKDRPVGLVMQRFTLYPHMSVRQNLAFPLKMRRVHRKERKTMVNKVIKDLKMSDFESYRTEDLSGGQAQRVALGKLIMREPKVALFDEAFSHLDPLLRKDLREKVIDHLLHSNQDNRRCVVFVSHEVADAKKADVIIVLKTCESENEARTTHHIFEGNTPGEAWKKMQASMKPDIIELVATTKD